MHYLSVIPHEATRNSQGLKQFHKRMSCLMLHSLPWHVAGRVAGRSGHFDVDLDAADAGCVRHCPALHAVHAELPAEHADWSLNHYPPHAVLTAVVSEWEAPVIALTHSGESQGERSAGAGQGCPCQGPAFEGWQIMMLCGRAPARERQYKSSITAQCITKMDSAQFSTTQHNTAQHSTACI